MDKARDLSNIDPLTVLKGVDQRLLAEVLDIVKATSAGAGNLRTVGIGLESERDRWGKTVPQGSKSTLNTVAKERTAPLRSILKQPSTSIKSKVDDLGSGGTVSDLQKNTMDGWLPAPSKTRAKSDGERNATKDTEEIGKVIETVVSRQFMTGARIRAGVVAANPWGVNEGHIPRCRPPFVRPVDPVIGPYQMRFPRPPPWHGEDHLRPPYPPPFAPLADGMVARPRLMVPPAEFNMGSRSRLVTPSQYDSYRQASQFPERAGLRFMHRGDHPFALAMNRDASFGGEVRFFPECASPSGMAFTDPWHGPPVEPVSQMFGGRDVHVKHVPEELKSFVSRKIIDHNHTRANLEESSLNSERTSLQRDEDFQWKHDRHRQSEEFASGKRLEDVPHVMPQDELDDHYEMELKRKFIKKIVGVNLPCDQETCLEKNKDNAKKSRRLETVDSGRLEKSDAKFSVPNTETPAPRGDYSWKIEGSSITDLDNEEERLRRKLLSEVERRKKDLERNLELYRLQNAGTEKSACELEKVLRKYSTGEWTDSSSFKAACPDVEFKDFCGFLSRKLEARDADVDSEDENSKTRVSFNGPDFISICKSLAATIEKRNKMVMAKEQSELDKRMSPNAAEKFLGITSEAPKLIFAPEKDIQRPTPEQNMRSSIDGSAMTKTRTVNRNEVPYPPPPAAAAAASPSSAKFTKEPGSSSVRSSTASASDRANRITESETGKFMEFLKEERATFWENLKAQLGERYSSQAPFDGGGKLKTKMDERSNQFPPSDNDCPDRTKTADVGDNKMESKETERHESLEVKAKKRRASECNKELIRIGKPRLDDTVGDAELKIQPKTFSKEKNRNKAVRKETKKPGEAKRQAQNASHNKKAFEDNLKTFQEDADWRRLIPEAVSSKDDLRRGETGVKSRPLPSSNVASKRSKIVRGLPKKVGAGTRMSGQRDEGRDSRQKTGPKLVSKDKDSQFQLSRKSSQSVKNVSLDDSVLQRTAAQLKKKTHPDNYLASSDHSPKKDAILYSGIEDVESSEEEEKVYSLECRTKDDVNRETEIKDIRERSHEDYDGRHLDKDMTTFDQNQRSYGFNSANKRQNRSGFRIRLNANSGRRHVEGFDPPGVSEAPWQKQRGFKDVDMRRNHNQDYRAGDFSGRGVKEYSDETNPVDRGDFPKYKNRYPRGRFGNQHTASGPGGHFQKNFNSSDMKEFDKSRHDNDDRKDQRFPKDCHLYEYPEEHAVRFGSKGGSRRLYRRQCSNDGRNDDEVVYNEQDYRPDPVFEDTWNQDDAISRRAQSTGRCSDGNRAMLKFTRPFQKEEQHFPRPEVVVQLDNQSGMLDEEYCSEEEESMEEDVDPCWNDRDLTDREAATGGDRWKNQTFETHRSRAFRHGGNAANTKQRFWRHKPWNNANRTGLRLPGATYRQNFVHQRRNKLNFKKAKASSCVTQKAWNPEGTLPATSHSLQDIIEDVMAKVEEAKSVDPTVDDAMFESLSRGEKKQVLEVQQMTGIASKTVIATALRTLWELEPKVVRTLGGLEPDWRRPLDWDRTLEFPDAT